MQHIVYITAKAKLYASENILMVRCEDEETFVHPDHVSAVIVESVHAAITIPAILLCVRSNISLILCNERCQPEAFILDYFRHTNLYSTLQNQINWAEDKKLQAWISIIKTKIQHQRKVLEYFDCNIDCIKALIQHENIEYSNFEELNSAEALCARIYFTALFGSSFVRFHDDVINSGLNYGYALIRAMIMSQLTARGLHPALGICHKSKRNRYNLADDIIEVVRPYVDCYVKEFIADKTIFDKDCREKLLSSLYGKVKINGSTCLIKNGIQTFIDSLIKYMNDDCEDLSLIKLDKKIYDKICNNFGL